MAILVVIVFLTSGFVLSVNILHLPLAILVIMVWAISLALLLSSMNVYYRDVQYLTEVTLMIGFYASPIIYSWTFVQSRVPEWLLELYLANPNTLSILGAQRVLWNSGTDASYPSELATRLLIALGVGLIVLWLCQRVFNRLQRNFAQEM